MGLDVYLHFDTGGHLSDKYLLDEDLRAKHRLSRTFCNFLCRRDAISGEPELDQIGKLTGSDISPLYEMLEYPDELSIDMELRCRKLSGEEKENFLISVEARRRKVDGNLGKVLSLVQQLLSKLSTINNLSEQLDDDDWDTLNSEVYFSEQPAQPASSFTQNNFLQDLRNLERALLYAKENGVRSVWFVLS